MGQINYLKLICYINCINLNLFFLWRIKNTWQDLQRKIVDISQMKAQMSFTLLSSDLLKVL